VRVTLGGKEIFRSGELDEDGRAEVLLKGGSHLPGRPGTAWIAALK